LPPSITAPITMIELPSPLVLLTNLRQARIVARAPA